MKALLLISLFIELATVSDASTLTIEQDLGGTKLLKKAGTIWSNCTKSTDMAIIHNMTITPYPTQLTLVTIKGNITFKEEITGGNVKIDVKYGVVPYYENNINLCDFAEQAGLNCPLAAKDYTFILKYGVPNKSPGLYTVYVRATDQDGKEIACVTLYVHLN